MNKKEDKATRYVQNKMFYQIANASRSGMPLFTPNDLKKAYIKGWDDAFLEIKNESENN